QPTQALPEVSVAAGQRVPASTSSSSGSVTTSGELIAPPSCSAMAVVRCAGSGGGFRQPASMHAASRRASAGAGEGKGSRMAPSVGAGGRCLRERVMNPGWPDRVPGLRLVKGMIVKGSMPAAAVRARLAGAAMCALLALLPALVAAPPAAAQARDAAEFAGWQRQAAGVTITRDDWGLAHVHGRSDADAVFGMAYAQAEDDFNRVETNFINAMGRLAEAEGESAIWQDLRMKLFIDPADLQRMYGESPAWLRELMDAWAAGLNYYLATHPEVEPRVITRFEPWMALSFSEGSIGGDIERVSLKALAAFYGNDPAASLAFVDEPPSWQEPTGSNGIAIAPSLTVGGDALLLINPHTSFFFRSELQMSSDEGLD